MNIGIKNDEAQKKQQQAHIQNLSNHLRTIQSEMEAINVKMLTKDYLAHGTIVHEMKRYLDLTSASAYIIQVGQWAYPEEKKVEARTDEGQDLTMAIPESPKMEIV